MTANLGTLFTLLTHNKSKVMMNIYVYIFIYLIIVNERSERTSYQPSYVGHLVDIQTALKPLKKSKKIVRKFYDHFRTT